MKKVSWRSITLLSLLATTILLGCQSSAPHRPIVSNPYALDGCSAGSTALSNHTTPEVDGTYILHHLEFDDQGWTFPDGLDGNDSSTPGLQVDCAIADLKHRLSTGAKVRMFVYVHGWHHSAKHEDENLIDFRKFLAAQAVAGPKREVIGFYISWPGETSSIKYLRDLTFWGRKNAAHHVAEGSVREFFARVKAIRNAVNRGNVAKDCGRFQGEDAGDGCPLRTVMIGHSFGAWILFASTAPYVMETLSGMTDFPTIGNQTPKLPRTHRERSIADLIILLNPAFEASRYEPLHRAAKRYRPASYETPILVSITSHADKATRMAFPLARSFNSALQYPAVTDHESEAMKRTHGHMPSYLTHDLACTLLGKPVDPEDRCLHLNLQNATTSCFGDSSLNLH